MGRFSFDVNGWKIIDSLKDVSYDCNDFSDLNDLVASLNRSDKSYDYHLDMLWNREDELGKLRIENLMLKRVIENNKELFENPPKPDVRLRHFEQFGNGKSF